MHKDNSATCLTQLLKLLNIQITRHSIIEELERHPYASTFLAFSDVLHHWKVPNGAFRVKSKDLLTIPAPFIVHLKSRGGEFALISEISKYHVRVSNERWDNNQLTLEEFSKLYTGNVLIAEPSANAGERDYHQNKRKELIEATRSPFVISGLFILTVVYLFSNLNSISWQVALLALAKGSGLLVSILLLIQSVDMENPWIKRLCTVSKRANCKSILSSKAAKVTEELSWSEVGFFYFGGTCLFLLFNIASAEAIQIMAFLNLFCLPYTLYSVYYQFIVVRKWCLLCCSVQALFWIEFALLFEFNGQLLSLPNFQFLYGIIASLLAPILLWAFIKPFIFKARQFEPIKQQLKIFKYNSNIFQRTLTQQPSFALPEQDHAIILGNKEPKQVITIVANPYCPPCSKAHQTLEEWLSQRDDLQLRIVFSMNGEPQEERNLVARHLMALNRQNKMLIRQALHDWYRQDKKDYKAWATLHPVEEEVESHLSLKKQREWCRMVDVVSTPTILINGYKLPDPYQLEDIKYFI